MSDITSLLSSVLTSDNLSKLSKETGIDSEKIGSLVSSALPTLLTQMADNASDEKGAESLSSALDDHAEKSESVASVIKNLDLTDGSKIIGHIFGDSTDSTAKKLSKSTGIDAKKVITGLAAIAPIVLAVVGKAKKSSKTNSSDLSTLLTAMSALSGGSSEKKSSTADTASAVIDLLGKIIK